jgi:hypothetical protein
MADRVQVQEVFSAEGNLATVDCSGESGDPGHFLVLPYQVVEAVADGVLYCHAGFRSFDPAAADRLADRVREAGSIDLAHWVAVG